MRLQGKVALISGAANGMGEAEARLFAREGAPLNWRPSADAVAGNGAQVVVADLLEAEGRQVVADITAAGGEARFVRLDVSSEEDWQEVVGTTVAAFGHLHILVNNFW